MAVNCFFLVTLLLLCLSHATLAVVRGTFSSARLIHNRPVVYLELKQGNNYVNGACGNLIHRSFIITAITPFLDPEFKNYHSYVRIGSIKSYEGGTVKRTDGHWPMKAIPEVKENGYIVLVRLYTPYNAPEEIDFAFVTYPNCSPRGRNSKLDMEYQPYMVTGFHRPNKELEGHRLSYAQVHFAYDQKLCIDLWEVQYLFHLENTVRCYVSWSCAGRPCQTGMYLSTNDDGSGMFAKNTRILVGIAQTHYKTYANTNDSLIPLIGYVEGTYAEMMKNMWLHQRDEFDGYPEHALGTGLFD